jgi:hypothetical protein
MGCLTFGGDMCIRSLCTLRHLSQLFLAPVGAGSTPFRAPNGNAKRTLMILFPMVCPLATITAGAQALASFG